MHAVMFFFLFNEFYKSTYKGKFQFQMPCFLQVSSGSRKTANGQVMNGSAKKNDDHKSNGTSNGGYTAVPKAASKAADYYVSGEVPANLTQRKLVK